MANKGYIQSLLNAVDAPIRKALFAAFEHTLDTFRLGDTDKAQNFAWYKFSSTTPATAGVEFSIDHGLNQVPTKVIPVVDLALVGSQLVGLTVSRAPDGRRVYFVSGSTSVPFTIYLEV